MNGIVERREHTRETVEFSQNGDRAVTTDYKIVVTGDVIAEAKLAMSQVRQSEQHVTVYDTASYMKPYLQAIGAASISEIIRRTLAGLPSISQREGPVPEWQRPVLLSLDSWEMFKDNEKYWSSYVVCEQVPKNPGANGDVAWRIKHKIGFDRKDPKDGLVDLSPDDGGDADLVIVNQSVGSEQSQFGFMGHEEKAWPRSLKKPKPGAWLLIEWSRPRLEPPFSDMWTDLLKRFRGRVIVVVTAEDLRAAGVRISRGISWERTLTDLFERIRELWACEPGQNRGPLCGCAQLVVSFGTSGAAIFTGPKGKLRAQLIYDPRHLEDSWQEQFEGTMSGFTRCLTAGTALEIVFKGRAFTELNGSGAKAGVIAARRVLETGFVEIGRQAPWDIELPKDLRFPSSVAARVLRSAVAEKTIVGTVEKAATELRAALYKPGAFEDERDIVALVCENLARQKDLHFDAVALTTEVERIYKDWTDNDVDPPERAPAIDRPKAGLKKGKATNAEQNGAVERDKKTDREQQRRRRLIERIMGFVAPDRDAITAARGLQDVCIREDMPLDGWSILEDKLPKGTDGEEQHRLPLVERLIGLVVPGRRGHGAANGGARAENHADPAWKILDTCRTIVEYGDSNDLPFPTLRMGKLLVTSRNELEGVTAVRDVMESYIRGNVRPPLSIAVFGGPGSGKSFSIKELAKNISGGRCLRVEDRTFNVSQFSAPEALAVALQQVRDLGLSGAMPLVFWDEFDTRYDGGMGWLRYFLAPMQDGKYQDGSSVYYVGRAIFVFAGGTNATMDEFIRKAKAGGKRDAPYTADAIAEKVPDFVSRLKGFIDIPTIDYTVRKGADGERVVIDAPTALRRAKLLRGSLEDSDTKLEETIPHDEGVYGPTRRKRLNVDPGVLGAFLRVKSFRYGARSMDAIVTMSALTGKNRYDRSSLPPDDQLTLHVDAKAFIKLANAGWPVPPEATAAASP